MQPLAGTFPRGKRVASCHLGYRLRYRFVRMLQAGGLLLAFSLSASAQATADPSSDTGNPAVKSSSPVAAQDATEAVPPTGKNRVFGVLPNYRTADGSVPFAPITPKQKFTIAAKDSFDYPIYLLSAAFAGLYQLEDQNPSFGQGMKGYAHRFATSYSDQLLGNMMAEAIIPTLVHHDPRYFRRGTGTTSGRVFYALTRVLVCKNDAGRWTFNVSEIGGNAVVAAIGNAYYPDNRSAGDTVQRLGVQVGTDAISNVLKEFWPDIHRKYFHRHHGG